MHWVDDGGHAWLVVPVALVRGDLTLSRTITHYSYEDVAHKRVYLEEDVDAPLFADATGVNMRGIPVTEINDFDEYLQRHKLIPYRHRRRRAA